MKKQKISFIKWELNGKNYSVVMRAENEEWEIEASIFSTLPKIQAFGYWLTRPQYVKATRDEFVEMYNEVNEMLNKKVMINL